MDLELEHHDVEWMLVSRATAPGPFQDASRRARALQWTIEFNVTDGMETALDFLDIEWTLVSQSSAPELFHDALRRALELGWAFEFKATDGGYDEFTHASTWPQTTFGSGTLTYPDGLRSLFWSTFATANFTCVTGGLYIKEFASSDDLLSGCFRAISTLGELFWTEQTLSLVLTLEDDHGVDLAPGLLGRYSNELWNEIGLEPQRLSCLDISRNDPRWVEVLPRGLTESLIQSVASMPAETQSTLLALEARLQKHLKERES